MSIINRMNMEMRMVVGMGARCDAVAVGDGSSP